MCILLITRKFKKKLRKIKHQQLYSNLKQTYYDICRVLMKITSKIKLILITFISIWL